MSYKLTREVEQIKKRIELISVYKNAQKEDPNPAYQVLINICKKQLKILK